MRAMAERGEFEFEVDVTDDGYVSMSFYYLDESEEDELVTLSAKAARELGETLYKAGCSVKEGTAHE